MNSFKKGLFKGSETLKFKCSDSKTTFKIKANKITNYSVDFHSTGYTMPPYQRAKLKINLFGDTTLIFYDSDAENNYDILFNYKNRAVKK